MKKKILVLALALALAVPALTSAKHKTIEDVNSSSFTVLSVLPVTLENNVVNTITIKGTGFDSITTPAVKLGAWTDDPKDDTDDSFVLTGVSKTNDTTITATVPVGAIAENNQDITVYDTGVTPNTHFTLAKALTIHPSFGVNDQDSNINGVVEVFQSNSSSSSAVFSLTVSGKKFKNKRWLKLRVGSKKAVITRVSRSGSYDTIVRAKFKYGKMAVGLYDIALTYKDRLREGVARNNKTKYRTTWENGTMTTSNAFQILLQPIQ